MRRSLQCLALPLAFAACGRDSADDLTPDGMGADGSPDGNMPPGAPTAAELLAKIATCDQSVGGLFARDSGGAANISICGLTGAVFWKADLDVDCDGKETPQCNLSTDPAFQAQTAATDSNGDFKLFNPAPGTRASLPLTSRCVTHGVSPRSPGQSA